MIAVPLTDAEAARFAKKVKRTADGCLLWTGALQSKGYGSFGHRGKVVLTHRLAYTIAYGQIPDGHHIDHLCLRKNCVEPRHLEAVTAAENHARQRGMTNGVRWQNRVEARGLADEIPPTRWTDGWDRPLSKITVIEYA